MWPLSDKCLPSIDMSASFHFPDVKGGGTPCASPEGRSQPMRLLYQPPAPLPRCSGLSPYPHLSISSLYSVFNKLTASGGFAFLKMSREHSILTAFSLNCTFPGLIIHPSIFFSAYLSLKQLVLPTWRHLTVRMWSVGTLQMASFTAGILPQL